MVFMDVQISSFFSSETAWVFLLFTEVLAFYVIPVFAFLDQLQLITNHANEVLI